MNLVSVGVLEETKKEVKRISKETGMKMYAVVQAAVANYTRTQKPKELQNNQKQTASKTVNSSST